MLAGLLFQFVAGSFVLALLYRIDAGKKKQGRVYGYLVGTGRDTFGIYLAHLLLLSCLLALWKSVGLPDLFWLKVAAVGVTTWVACQFLVWACRHPRLYPVNRLLFGASKQRKTAVSGTSATPGSPEG